MSYTNNGNGKEYYEQELINENNNKLTFDKWYEHICTELEETYINNYPEDFPTDESMQEIQDNGCFQSWVEDKYEAYLNE